MWIRTFIIQVIKPDATVGHPHEQTSIWHRLQGRRIRQGQFRRAVRRFRRRSDYAETGGAPLVGVDGVVLICHGASDARAIKNGVLAASELVRARLRQEMVQAVAEHAYLWHEDAPADGAERSA